MRIRRPGRDGTTAYRLLAGGAVPALLVLLPGTVVSLAWAPETRDTRALPVRDFMSS